MQSVVIVNASNLLMDEQVRACVPALQTQVDRDFLPAWKGRATQAAISFATAADIPHLDPHCWPIFLNRHSDEPDDLGWHDDRTSRIFSRVFVGDALKDGLNWGITLSHELLEMILDPDIVRVWQMPDGRLAALEACDACEADELAYAGVAGIMLSDFVLPAYFSTGAGPYDFCGALHKPCPALTPGGYMSIADAAGNFTQIQADRHGKPGRRASMQGHRRLTRAHHDPRQLLQIINP